MKKIIFCLLFVKLLMNTSFAVDSVWVNYASFTNYYELNFLVIDRNNTKWIGTYQNGMYRYKGNTWTKIDTSNSPLPFQLVNAMAVDSNNTLWLGNFHVVGGLPGGLVSYDGTNWTQFKTTNSGLCCDQIWYLGVEKNNSLWICTAYGLSKYYKKHWSTYNILDNQIFCISFDDSIKWIGTQTGLARFDNVNWTYYTMNNSGLPSNYVTRLAVDSSHNVWVATMFGGVAKYNYPLNQWTVFNENNSGLPNNNTSCIYVDNQQGIWVGTSGPMARLFNNSWTLFYQSPVFGYPTIRQIANDKYFNIWFCLASGICTYFPNGITSININQEIISDFTLYQNYPNPFNAKTNIRYNTRKSSNIKIYIYSINGKQIDLIDIGRKSNGDYSVNYNAENLSSGIYFYSLIIDNKLTCTKKFVILK